MGLMPISRSVSPGRSSRTLARATDAVDRQMVFILLLRLPLTILPPEPPRPPSLDLTPLASNAVGGFRPFIALGAWLPDITVPPRPVPSGVGLGTVGGTPIASGSVAGSPVGEWERFTPQNPSVSGGSLGRFATEDMTTSPTDPVSPNDWFDGRIHDVGSLSRAVTLAAFDRSSLSVEIGRLTLNNADGVLDSLIDSEFLPGVETVLAAGSRGGRLDTFAVLATGRAQTVDVGLTECTIEYTGTDKRFEDDFYPDAYLGTGGMEGPETLAGTRKPHVLGQVFNMQPVLIDANTFVLQAHDGSLAAVTAARFGGVAHIFTQDLPTLEALQAAPLAIGEYATCLLLGLIRMGLTQGGLSGGFSVTCDVARDTVDVTDILLEFEDDIRSRLATNVNTESFVRAAQLVRGFTYGRLITTTVTWRDVMDDLCRNANLYWGSDRSGAITVARLREPSSLNQTVLELDQDSILDIDRMGLPAGYEFPHKERVLQFRRNWSVLSSVAAIVQDAALGSEWRKVTVKGPSNNKNATSPDAAETNLQTEASARQLAEDLLSMHGRVRSLFLVTIPMLIGLPGELEQVRVMYPRFGLDAGRYLMVVATTENYDSLTVQLTLWG